MGRVLWFVVGLAVGVAAMNRASSTTGGRRILGAVKGTTGEFLQTVADSYHARRAETGAR